MKKLLIILVTAIMLSPLNLKSQSTDALKAVKSNNEFCFDWLKNSYKPEENIFFSPQSISIAMSMTYDGAKWKTKKEIAKVLHFQLNTKKNHKNWIAYIHYFDQIKTPLFNSANGAWIQEDVVFSDSYIEALKQYKSKIKGVNFKNTTAREESRKRMNKWVEHQTQNKIKQLIRKGDIDELTRLVLINAIYFNAQWQTEFPKRNTFTSNFFANSKTIPCNFMNNTGEYKTYHTENFTMLEIPYKAGLSSMIIILPTEGHNLEQILSELDFKTFKNAYSQLSKETIKLSIPKFSLKNRFEMKKQFRSMGITNAFSEKANFKGMNGKKNLMIDEVIHQAMIEVNEEGTEASAATAVVVRDKSASFIELKVNRPFVFLIRENHLNSILFAGILETPNK